MADPIPVPVGILRLPRGPDSSGSRGFSCNPRNFQNPHNSQNSQDFHNSQDVQNSRAELRARFLRLLSSARGRPARFSLWNGLELRAEFGAADVHTGAFQVDSLQTPLGIQGSALLRCGDVLEFSFPLE
ncbi:gem-associated protein 7 [Catharus ustulatus]|uniref:SUZ-C domain-containing protein n=1 Tax=Catharus ustulatus TaxID=91951 RepID=A0A8C3UX95_CATUS|nr:gem-associated protein 7 [Catharus ustulatus]XP_032939848.1 gem-associated protein 7 [Catharus ustulatus]XP_032939849.1 gem-associated protein 7 [Catharus ustulatus]XP_032939850.1 gem-associated protein 7 [Catharus ustulatus]XP_032939851.1 gem-associated protein 7 [Catharus ustulatus]XP_032939852.1 gem-associated protein 7 [Catharus ustulatus]XP_032939853.1 gem-associated protein 7 [Catharus ustulatus]XP_032939854.1 gem-associated protein 7 [Catharus ustulatus]XP_032939855.1 gem-associat